MAGGRLEHERVVNGTHVVRIRARGPDSAWPSDDLQPRRGATDPDGPRDVYVMMHRHGPFKFTGPLISWMVPTGAFTSGLSLSTLHEAKTWVNSASHGRA